MERETEFHFFKFHSLKSLYFQRQICINGNFSNFNGTFVYLAITFSRIFFDYSAIPNSFMPRSEELYACSEFAADILSRIQNFDSALIQHCISVHLALNSRRETGFLPSGKGGEM